MNKYTKKMKLVVDIYPKSDMMIRNNSFWKGRK